MNTLEKAERELADGNLWRAKEILQGAIRSAGYNAELFESLGNVLLRMRDLPEAGRFLFLSGTRKPEYEESISLFLQKHSNDKPREFLRILPRKARLNNLADYPDEVAHKLRELGCPEVLGVAKGIGPRVVESSGTLFRIGCVTVTLILLVLIILGASKALEMLSRLK